MIKLAKNKSSRLKLDYWKKRVEEEKTFRITNIHDVCKRIGITNKTLKKAVDHGECTMRTLKKLADYNDKSVESYI